MKHRIIKFAAALLAALCLLPLLPVQASTIHMNIRVAVKGKCPPYHFWDGDTATGLNIDILERMAEKEGLNVEYVSYTTSSDAADALLSGEVDAVLGVLAAAGKDHQSAGLGVQPVDGADAVGAQHLPQQ